MANRLLDLLSGRWGHLRLPIARRILGAILAATVTALLGFVVLTASAWAVAPTQITTYDRASSVYDVGQTIARLHNASDPRRGHSYHAAAGPMDNSASVRHVGDAAKTVDEVLPGVKTGGSSRVADNGTGTVWQAPGSTGNANMLRVMEPTERYPNGYVRFYNEHGQPIGLNGKPGPRPDTHIPRKPDGTYELPEGW